MSTVWSRKAAPAWRPLSWAAAGSGLWLALSAACGGSESACTPGQSSPCACPGAATGAQVCDAEGAAYGACNCGVGAGGAGAGTGAGGARATVDYGSGEYGIALSTPPRSTYCWYIEETVRVCDDVTKDENYADICYENETNCLARQPEGSETETSSCWTRILYENISGGPLPGDCAMLEAYQRLDPAVECLYHRHCRAVVADARCVDYKCACPDGDCPKPGAPIGGGPGGGAAGSGAGPGGGSAGSGAGPGGGSAGSGGNGGGVPPGPSGGGGSGPPPGPPLGARGR